ncbi:acetylornithine aminotransferase [Actinomycetes bacterium]|nr:acetylornithine aminotransferase [Actinomycetes bacterium]
MTKPRKFGNSLAQAIWSKAIQPNYGIPPIALVKGKGAIVYDVDGKKYLDFLGGIATNLLGHAHPVIIKAVMKQMSTLSHVSNFYMHPQVLQLAQSLQKMTGDKNAKVFFCNSGAEANEAAIKLSRLTGRTNIVAARGAFHGRTMGAISLTGQPAKRDPFKPLLRKIKHVNYGDIAALRRAVTSKTAMVILEPIMGEAGVVVPPKGYLKAAREICDKTGALLVIDAVQTGMGRTGTWFGYEVEDITPDVITIAKGLGGGLPLGAMIALGGASNLFKPGDHGSTFGGNPVACAAANATIGVIKSRSLLKSNLVLGNLLKIELTKISGILDVRGRGLLIGIVLKSANAKALAADLLSNGVLVNATSDEVIRIAPAFIITKKNVMDFVGAFQKSLGQLNG